MPNFLEAIFAQLKQADARVVLREIRGEQFVSVTGGELLQQVQRVRAYLRNSGIQAGDRCALVSPNSIRWIVFDLAPFQPFCERVFDGGECLAWELSRRHWSSPA